jgi:hypothetical protein
MTTTTLSTLTPARRAELARDHALARREERLRRQLAAALEANDAEEANRLRAEIEANARSDSLRRF